MAFRSVVTKIRGIRNRFKLARIRRQVEFHCHSFDTFNFEERSRILLSTSSSVNLLKIKKSLWIGQLAIVLENIL